MTPPATASVRGGGEVRRRARPAGPATGSAARARRCRRRPARSSRGGHPLARLEALVGAEPADLGDHPLQRGQLRLGGVVDTAPGRRSARRPRPPSRRRSARVHSSSVTNGMTGCSSRSSWSSTCPSTRRVASAALGRRRPAPAWSARRTSRRRRPRRSGRACRRPWRTRTPRSARRPRR